MIVEMDHIFKIQAEKKGLKFIIEIDREIPSALVIDDLRLRQVLLNIIGNALKFTEKGFVKVSLKNLSKSKIVDKIDIAIIIEDSGIGIESTSIDTIFDLFKQQDGQDNKKYGGTGLGLSISKKLINEMGGEILVQSTVNKGSVFEVILKRIPIATLESSEINFYNSLKIQNFEFEKADVLIVDDIESNRQIVEELLLKIGLNPISAENGEKALKIISSQKPALIFMDIRMPVLDGIKATEILKLNEETKNIPIIALTAAFTLDNKDYFLKKGFDQFLEKPIKLDDILHTLSKYLKHSFINKNTTVVHSLENVDFENIQNPSELIYLLNNEIKKSCDSLKNMMVMSSVEDFGNRLNLISKKYNINYLSVYSKEIIKFSDSFDTVGIEESLNQLLKDIEQFNLKWREFNGN